MKRWPTKLLGEVVTCLDSQRIPVKDDDRQRRLGTVPYYGANGQVGWINEAIFDEPLLLVAEDGGHFNEPERGVAYTIRGPSWINNHAHALRPDESKVLLDFLGYYFRHFDFRPYITGTTRAKLTQRDLMRADVPVPPLAEQERIVKLLDEADELRKLRTQVDRRTAQLIPALFHEMFGDPDTNPKKLPIVRLEMLLSFRTGKLDSNAAVKDGVYPFFTCSREDFRIDTYQFDCEALLLSGNNATADYSVKHYKGKFNAYQRTYVLNLLNSEHSYGFMQQALQLRLQELKRVSLGTNTKYLTLTILKDIKIPLPIPTLQKKFAQWVTEIRELEAQETASRKRLDNLFQSMLHRAFNGEL